MRKPALIAILLVLLLPCIAGAGEKILVIGVISKDISEIDGRILREETMRRLHNDGFAVVPVMDIERELRERATLSQIIADKDIFPLAASFGAQWTIKGVLSSNGDQSRLFLEIYRTADNRKYSSTIDVPDGEFPEIIPELSSRIARKTGELIRSKVNRSE
ncbi:MAG TPA: hypothetical protein PKK43_00925 [Spirochaetota bacterium]|nr:hypothetical protein [Spirochaetota bacterium]